MKEIKYESNLKEDIKSSKEYNLRNGIILRIVANIISFIILALLGFFTNVSISTLISYIVFLGIMDFIFIRSEKRRWDVKKEIAADKLYELSYEIKSENDINLSKNNLKDSVLVETKSITSDNEPKISSSSINLDFNFRSDKTEKIIQYFYMLDENEKLAVLKQVTETIKKNRTTETKHNLFLLEDEDLEKIDIPFKKKLVPKKR